MAYYNGDVKDHEKAKKEKTHKWMGDNRLCLAVYPSFVNIDWLNVQFYEFLPHAGFRQA